MAEGYKKRRPDIMFLNILFCLLVIFIHIASEVVLKAPKDTTLFKVIYVAQKLSSFVVPGFVLLSGVKLFLNYDNKPNYPKYYWSRIKRVVIPYVLWCFIYYAWICYRGNTEFNAGELLLGIFTGNIWAHFYFVVILIQFIILTPLWIKLYNGGNSAVHISYSILLTALSVMFLPSVATTIFPSTPNFDVSACFLRYLAYWTAGCLIGKNYNAFIDYIKGHKISILLRFLIFGAADGYIALVTFGREPVWLELFHMLYAASAILFFYMISQVFSGKGQKLLIPMYFFDRSSYLVYLVHCLIIIIADEWMTAKGITGLNERLSWRAISVYVISILLATIWQMIRLIFVKRKKG